LPSRTCLYFTSRRKWPGQE